MTTAVTGANGHLGCNLVRALADAGDVRAVIHHNQDAVADVDVERVRGDLLDPHSLRKAFDGVDVERVRGDLLDPHSLRKAFDGVDTVFHLAARISITGDRDGLVHETNVLGARNAATAALDAGVSRFIHVSSVHAFDLRSGDRIDESSPRSGAGNYAYDRSKAAGEAEVRKVIDRGLDATIVNPTGIIGPQDHAPSRMGNVFLDLAHRRMPALVRGGFDFVDVRDVVQGALAARDRGVTGANYLLGGHHLSVREVAMLAADATGVQAPRLTLPQWMAYPGIPFAAMAARRSGVEPRFTRESLDALRHGPHIDCSRARKRLEHRPTDAATTVKDTYQWFEERGMWERP